MCSFRWVSFLWRFKLGDDDLFSHLLVSLLMIFTIIHNSIHWRERLVMHWEEIHIALDSLEKNSTSLLEDF